MLDGARVAFVVDGALDQPTGGYLYDRLVIEGLRARGCDVDVVNLDVRGPLASLRENTRLLRLLAPRAYDVVIIDELCHPRAAFAAALRARSSASPRLVTLLHHLAASERTGVSAKLRLALERTLLTASDHVVVTSETTARVAIAAGIAPDRITVVHPGRDRLGARAAPPARTRGAPVRLLFLGALTPRKDPLALLEAFPAVAARAVLTLAGPADRDPLYAARVLAAASRYGTRVRVTGALTDAALADELGAHDVLVLPSRYEGYGIVLAEAASHGLAIVSCDAGAIPEVVRHGEEALLVPPGDPRALEGALVRVVQDEHHLDAMQRAALRRAATLPTWADTQDAFCRAVFPTSR
ncbi:glycosyltransferase family 4 protein [Polyangium jinanense]|uniref:Glycosyltransferase family 4 protein n=1 Tax=Polyangium jinanense TaxID=2829994 RepID=A0A9X3X7Q0_9BACT|nr:glycosyltransferase family 4 protein [Polyangium jinanense]MDC3954253.1 glycosyltransferase family 4 protein [Polyangium jinanense]MDC3984295.1 glycosyltransferase family 4 protein [Polyangium jinanense]